MVGTKLLLQVGYVLNVMEATTREIFSMYLFIIIISNLMIGLFHEIFFRCGNVAAIFELDEHLQKEFIIFEAAPQETRGVPVKKPLPDYFL